MAKNKRLIKRLLLYILLIFLLNACTEIIYLPGDGSKGETPIPFSGINDYPETFNYNPDLESNSNPIPFSNDSHNSLANLYPGSIRVAILHLV
jgi:hypothetical protein